MCVVLFIATMMSLLNGQLWVSATSDPDANIHSLCDQSVRNFQLLTPREADAEPSPVSGRNCVCNMVHEATWGAPKIEIDCTALELHNENIIPRSLPFGTQLFDLSWNSLSRIPRFYQNLDQLKVFRLNNNHITKIEKDDLSRLSYLEELDVSNNDIETIETFDSLTALKHLKIAYNNLRTLPDLIFDKLTNLIHLSLSGNDMNALLFEKNIYSSLGLNTQSLQVLELDYCKLTWLAIEAGESLLELRLRGNAFFKEFPILSPNIKLLDLSANPIRRLDSTFYPGKLKQLETLLLEDMPNLYILDVSSMATFHNLRKLSLQNSKNFTYFNKLAFDPIELEIDLTDDNGETQMFDKLDEINLTGTKVQKLSEELHAYIPNVEFIALDGCPMVCDCDLKWLLGKRAGIRTNGICEKPLSTQNLRIDDIAPESIKNCSEFSRFMFKIINGLLIILMIILVGVGMYFLVMGCRPSKKFYIRQRLGVNSPYSRITVEPLGAGVGHQSSYRPTTSQA